MKDISYKILFLFLLTILSVNNINANSDTEKLRRSFINELKDLPINSERTLLLVNSLTEKGFWPGIDYENVSREAFQHSKHLENMLYLSRAFVKDDSPFKGNVKVKKAVMLSLDYWLKNDFICENWWNNQIGTPNVLVSMLLLLDKNLSKERSEKMKTIIERGNINASGARPSGDRIKMAGIQAKCALYQRNEKEFEKLIRIIENEIKFSIERGMQHDYSFHHRIDWVNNTISYGSGYADAFAEWAGNVLNTKYRFSDRSVNLLIDYYLDGICKQMVFGLYPDCGIMNRDLTRPDSQRNWSSKTPERLMKITSYRKEDLDQICKIRNGENIIPSSFSKSFWRTDHFVFQRPRFYTSVRMYSTRTSNMEEPYNGEGLTNHFRGDGTNYLSSLKKEYDNLAPIYDWMKIPGATIAQIEEMPSEKEIQKWGIKEFSGSVSDGLYGAVGFDFVSPHSGIKAKKSWFFFDDEYVCLGSGIKVENKNVVTAINQCLLDGEVKIKNKSVISSSERGNHDFKDLDWIWHGDVGYIFPPKMDISYTNEEAKGRWFDVNRQTTSSKEEIKKDVFKLWINHKKGPESQSYQYIVIPAISFRDFENYDSSIRLISNTEKLQAVCHEKLNIAYGVFYKNGVMKINENLSVSADAPSIIMIKYNDNNDIISLAASDPCHSMGSLSVSVNRKMKDYQDERLSVKYNDKEKSSSIFIKLPQNEYSGESVVFNL